MAHEDIVPFDTAEDAWFWFIAAQEAKNDGAQFVAGAGLYKRPCEPIDILKVLERLYRSRRLTWDHVKVLRHYGVRHMAPDRYRPKEMRAYDLWKQALEYMEDALITKGIVRNTQKSRADNSVQAFIESLQPSNTSHMSPSYGFGAWEQSGGLS